MSSIRNNQRRALERFVRDDFEPINAGSEYFLDGNKIFLLGVSEGIGTCADLRGVDIAVFGEYPPQSEPIRGHIKQWAAAALFRHATQEEKREQPHPEAAHAVVEELAVYSRTEEKLEFRRTGRKVAYVNTIC